MILWKFVGFDKYFFPSAEHVTYTFIRVIAQVGIWFLRCVVNFQLTLSLISNRVSIRWYFFCEVENEFLISIILSNLLREKRIFSTVPKLKLFLLMNRSARKMSPSGNQPLRKTEAILMFAV